MNNPFTFNFGVIPPPLPPLPPSLLFRIILWSCVSGLTDYNYSDCVVYNRVYTSSTLRI